MLCYDYFKPDESLLMKAIELEMSIGDDGMLQIPDEYQRIFGQKARFVILLPDAPSPMDKPMDPMKYSSTLDWPVEAMAYQQAVRKGWR